MANLRRFDEVSDGSWNDPFAPDVNGDFYNPNQYTPPNPPPVQTAPPPPAGGAPAAAPSNGVHTEWFGGGGPQGQYSRGLEDAFLNFSQGYTGPKDAASLAAAFGNGARAVGGDTIDFGYGPVDVIKDAGPGGSNELWFGGNNVYGGGGRDGGGGGNAGGGSYAPAPAARTSTSSSNSNSLGEFMGQSAPYRDSADYKDIMGALKSLFPQGAYNQDIVNRRTENARENLGRQRKSQDATDRAVLASRGTLGSGPEITAMDRNNQNIADQYQNAVSGIYADEENAASQRMMAALQTAAGMSQADAENYVRAYMGQTERGLGLGNLGVAQQNANTGSVRAANDFTLGQGNLALGNMNGINNYNLGLAQYGLDRDKTLQNADQNQMSNIIELLKLGYSLDDLIQRGYIP